MNNASNTPPPKRPGRFARGLCYSLLGCLAATAVSCASFPSEKLPRVVDMPNQGHYANKPSMYFALQVMCDLSDGTEAPRELAQPLHRTRKIIERVANEASLFHAHTFQSFGPAIADFILEVKILNYGSRARAKSAALATCYTLGLVPTAATDHYRLEARLLNHDGKVLREYIYEDKLKTWFGLWMIPQVGKTPRKAFDSVIENMTRTLLRDILREDLLPYSSVESHHGELETAAVDVLSPHKAARGSPEHIFLSP